jgi:hypothetical protein
MVTVFPAIDETLVQASGKLFSTTTMRLGKTLCARFKLAGMRDVLARGQREEIAEAGIKTGLGVPSVRNGLGSRIDKEAQIPARGTFDYASTFEASWGKRLGVKPHMAYARHRDTRPIGGFEGIRQGNTGELISLTFEPGFLGQLFITPLPRCIRGIEYPLQGMTRDAELLAVVSEQIMEGLRRVIDAIFGIQFDLAYRPIPHARKL